MKSSKFIRTTLLSLVFVLFYVVSVFAGTGVIQFGDPTVTRDKTFNLAIKVKSTDVRLKSADITIQYNPTMIEFIEGTNSEGGAGTVRVNGTGVGKGSGTRTLEYQLKFKALYAGTATVTVLDQEVVDNTGNLVNITKQGSSKITIKPSSTQSKNANLSTLEFHPGELDRDFDPSVLSYNTEVNADVESLTMSAIPEDKDAKVTISGNENFSTGMNKVSIDVTAPDNKTKKQYVLNVTKLETGVTDGVTTITNGQRFSSNKYTITIMIKPDDVDVPSGYKKLKAEFGGNTMEAYGPTNTPDGETPDIFLVYGMNSDGIIDFYRYDTRNGDNTIQRYVPEPNSGNYEELSNKYNALATKFNTTSSQLSIVLPVAIGLLALTVILVVVLIIVMVKNGNGKKSSNPYSYDDDDDDDEYFSSSRPTKITSKDLIAKSDDDDLDNDNDDIEDLG